MDKLSYLLPMLVFYGTGFYIFFRVLYSLNKRRAKDLEAQAQVLALLQEIRDEIRALAVQKDPV